ncbi:hypothetical protein [Anthocerotibacter panamensis]|uniref:hypothetical protein n=1 Tax=Anthocerotibacter panamensis TaxID=2857077 RepID=UPI001C404FB1|nr:hypothetical protein [Anthocerotibacter panamensis]
MQFIQIISDRYLFGNLIRSAWDSIWSDIISPGSSLYQSLCTVGIAIALIAIGIFVTRWARATLEGEVTRPFSELFWPVAVVALLVGNGALLAQLTLGIRGGINQANNLILDNTLDIGTVGAVSLIEAFQQVAANQASQMQASNNVVQCQPTQIALGQSAQCNQSASALSQPITSGYSSIYGFTNTALSNTLQGNQNNALNNLVTNTSTNGASGNGPNNGIASINGANTQDRPVFTTLLNNQAAFQQGIEMAMLLVAVLGPLALGAALLSPNGRPFIGWIGIFFAIGVAKLTYSIVLCLIAIVILKTFLLSTIVSLFIPWYPFVGGIVAPALSFASGIFAREIVSEIVRGAVRNGFGITQ